MDDEEKKHIEELKSYFSGRENALAGAAFEEKFTINDNNFNIAYKVLKCFASNTSSPEWDVELTNRFNLDRTGKGRVVLVPLQIPESLCLVLDKYVVDNPEDEIDLDVVCRRIGQMIAGAGVSSTVKKASALDSELMNEIASVIKKLASK